MSAFDTRGVIIIGDSTVIDITFFRTSTITTIMTTTTATTTITKIQMKTKGRREVPQHLLQ